MKPVKAIVVEESGDARLVTVDSSLDSLNKLVGGWLEVITPMTTAYGHWHGYVDEEGKFKPHYIVNGIGTDLAEALGWPGKRGGDYLVGPLVILGSDGAEEADVPEETMEAVKRFYDRYPEDVSFHIG